MKTHLKVENPDDIEMTLTVTLSVKHWRALAAPINSSSYPGWDFLRAIHDLVRQAETHFFPKEEA